MNCPKPPIFVYCEDCNCYFDLRKTKEHDKKCLSIRYSLWEKKNPTTARKWEELFCKIIEKKIKNLTLVKNNDTLAQNIN
jgi:hypothetical protein